MVVLSLQSWNQLNMSRSLGVWPRGFNVGQEKSWPICIHYRVAAKMAVQKLLAMSLEFSCIA